MTVFIDMDGVLADFNLQFMKRVKRAGLLGVESTSWNLEDRIDGVPKKLKKAFINSILSAPGYWKDIPVIDGAIEGMRHLIANKKLKIFVATSPWYSAENCVPEKLAWLRKHVPSLPLANIIFINKKSMLRGDIIVDDRPEHVEQWTGPHAICVSQPWNEHVKVRHEPEPVIWRAGNWDSIVTIVHYIADRNGKID